MWTWVLLTDGLFTSGVSTIIPLSSDGLLYNIPLSFVHKLYAFFICLLFYWHFVLFLNFFIGIFLNGVGVPCGIIFYQFLVSNICLPAAHGSQLFLTTTFLLEPHSLWLYSYSIISCSNYGVLIFISIIDWVFRAPLRIGITINHLWWFLYFNHLLYTIYYWISDE